MRERSLECMPLSVLFKLACVQSDNSFQTSVHIQPVNMDKTLSFQLKSLSAAYGHIKAGTQVLWSILGLFLSGFVSS